LLEAYQQHGIKEICVLLDSIYAEILQSSEEAPWQDNILYTFGLGIVPDKEKYGPILKTGYIDMMPRNAFWYQDSIYWFDQEWVLENVPTRYIMYRILKEFYCSFPDLIDQESLSVLVNRYELLDGWDDYDQIEKLFVSVVADNTALAENRSFCEPCEEAVIHNINSLLNQ
jgi:hypothetical protein